MGFFKDLFNDIKTHNTPISNYKDKITDYMNFISIESYRKGNLSKETAQLKSIASVQEIKELASAFIENLSFKLYIVQGDVELNINASILFIENLLYEFESGELINHNLLKKIINRISQNN